MGNAVLKNPRVVTVNDPIFGPRKEAQADLWEVEPPPTFDLALDNGMTVKAITPGILVTERFICVVSLGKPVEPEELKTVAVLCSCGQPATMKYVVDGYTIGRVTYFCDAHKPSLIGAGRLVILPSAGVDEPDAQPAPPSTFRPTT